MSPPRNLHCGIYYTWPSTSDKPLKHLRMGAPHIKTHSGRTRKTENGSRRCSVRRKRRDGFDGIGPRMNRTVLKARGDGVQPDEDVEADSRGRAQSPYRRIAFSVGGVSVRPGWGRTRRDMCHREGESAGNEDPSGRRVPLLRRPRTYSSAPC